MSAKTPRYLIGIDLGTTHTVVAYADLESKHQDIQIFEIEQLLAPGEVAARPLLPSVRYHPAKDELSESDTVFNPSGENAIIGAAARFLGAKTQGRLVTSAKSWLSHPSVDHNAAILPWGSAKDINKVSPIAASASYLAHVRAVWLHKFPEYPLEKQEIVITVPASFDESARSLTLEAARIAGINKLRLLEEPQAVCYDWLRRHKNNLQETLKNIHLLLVCDVGGGTTDLTLIKVEPGKSEPELSRIGVGDHLMLGGDNIDLALAHIAEKRLLATGKKLSSADMSQLIEQCRNAKERLLSNENLESYRVTLLGGGSQLIGGTRSTELTRQEVLKIALDGFFPLSNINELPDKKRSGVVEFGLPYAAEPAISKHIAAFLMQHKHAASAALGTNNFIPDAVLLNGGVFRSPTITGRLLDLITSWQAQAPQYLENIHPELAVAYGAVSYAMARRGKQIRIGGGSARSYFLLLDNDQVNSQQGICILPRGSEEGSESILQDRQFSLKLGQPIRFNLVSASGDSVYKSGDIVQIDDQNFHTLPPLAVAFDQVNLSTLNEVTVQLSVTYSEVGTLHIQCVSVADNNLRWDVEFQIRKSSTQTLTQQSGLPSGFTKAVDNIHLTYGKKSKDINPKAIKSLRANMEKSLGYARTEWDTPLLRNLFTEFLEGRKYRRRSANHERIWLNLTGYCLRPGFGYTLDDWRVEQVWKTYSQNLQFVNEVQNWTEWWTLWRRIAGGLPTEAQEIIFSDLSKYLNPASARQASIAKQLKLRSYEEMVRLAAVLERLPVTKKNQLGEWLLKRLQKPSEPNQTWWALGRIGSRIPFHGSSHNVVPVETVTLWLEQILLADWKKIPQAGFAATLIARMCGDRARDLDLKTRNLVIDKLKLSKTPASWSQMVAQIKELDAAEEKQIFGEALPPGLKLINPMKNVE